MSDKPPAIADTVASETDPLARTVAPEIALAPTAASDHAVAVTVATGDALAETAASNDAGVIGTGMPELPTVARELYRLEGEVARGGMGRIVRAQDTRIGRTVAIKETLSPDPMIAVRFEREAVITARLQHPAIVPVYEAGRWPNGDPFYAMKLVAGNPLDKVIAATHTLEQRIALLPHVISVCEALAYAHDRGVVHRDLKPGNILVGDYGETVVIDWGLAKHLGTTDVPAAATAEVDDDHALTRLGAAIGTPAYMAPEQARGEAVDTRADVYALGAILYNVLSGVMPYEGARSAKELIERVLAGPPPTLATRVAMVPAELATIVARAMERDPADRYPTARELAADLHRFVTGQLVSVHVYSLGEMMRRWIRKHRGAVITGAILIAILAVVAVISVKSVMRARDLANERRLAVLEEQGRQELVAGRPGRAMPYFDEAWRGGRRTSSLAVMRADARGVIDTVDRAMVAGDTAIAKLGATDDGKIIALTDDGILHIWHRDSQAVTYRLKDDFDSPLAVERIEVRVARDGKHAAVGELTTSVIDLATGLLVAEVADQGPVAVDGARLVTSTPDAIALWDLSAKPLRLVTTIPKATHAAMVDWSGRRALAAFVTDRFELFDAETGERLVTPDLPIDARFSVDRGLITEDARWALMIGKATGTTPVFRIIGVELATARTVVVDVVGEAIDGIEITPNNDRLVIWNSSTVTIVDLSTHRIVAEIVKGEGETIGGVVVLEVEGRSAAVVFVNGVASLVDATTGLQTDVLDGHVGAVRALAAVPPHHVVTGGEDGRVVVWSPRSRIALGALRGAIAISPDGRRIARIDGMGVRITGEQPGMFVEAAGVRAADVAWNTNRVAIVEDAGTMVIASERARIRVATTARSCSFSPSGERVVSVEAHRLHVWESDGTAVATLDGQRDVITAVKWFPDGRHLATVGDDGQARLWSLAGGTSKVLEDKPGPMGAIAVSPDGALVAIGSSDGRVRVYGIDGVRRLELGGTAPPITAIAFADDGALIAAGGPDGVVHVFAITDGHEVEALDHETPIASIAFRDDGAVIATAGSDPPGGIRLWSPHSGVRLGTRAGLGIVDFVDGGHALAVRSASGAAVWRDPELPPRHSETLGVWQLIDGRLVPRIPYNVRRQPTQASTFDFEDDLIQGEIVLNDLDIFWHQPRTPTEELVAPISAALERGARAEAVRLADSIDDTKLDRADLLALVAYTRYHGGNIEGAVHAALAMGARATPAQRGPSITALVAFASRSSSSPKTVVDQLLLLAPDGRGQLDLARGYAEQGRDEAAQLVLENLSQRPEHTVAARLAQADLAGATDRPSDVVRHLESAFAMSSAEDVRVAAARHAERLAQTFLSVRDRRYGDAARAIYQRLRSMPGVPIIVAARAANLERELVQALPASSQLAKASVRPVIRAHAGELRACYENALIATPDLAGKVVLLLVIDGIGAVIHAAPASTTSPQLDGVATCIVDRAKTWFFPTNIGKLIVNYPFVFRPAGS